MRSIARDDASARRYTPRDPMAQARALDSVERAGRSSALGPLLALAALTVAIHVAVNVWTPYGIHRDELLYLAMGRHLRLWRMDFPPGIAIVAELSRGLFGESLVALRIVPAIAHAALVVLAATIARAMGGTRAAQLLAAVAVLAGPLFLRTGNLLQPVILDQLAWTVALLMLTRLGDRPTPGRWIGLGIAAGLGLLVKFSALYFGAAFALAIVLSPLRRELRTIWPWLSFVVALAIGSPGIAGQVALDWPVVAQMRDLQAAQLSRVTPWAFMAEQLLFGPATLLALLGAAVLLFAHWARPFRATGLACVLAFLLLAVLGGKSYYFGPMYPTLYAAGAIALARVPRLARTRVAVASALVVAYGVVMLPVGLPILPPAAMARYASTLGMTAVVRTNTGGTLPLPQDYADMLPWEGQAAAVARVYHALPPDERADAVILADNYGEAGAIDYYGPRHGLPPAVLPASSYWFFGPGPKPGRVLVTIGVDSAALAEYYDSVTVVERLTVTPYAAEEERDVPLLVGRAPRTTLQAMWPSLAGRN